MNVSLRSGVLGCHFSQLPLESTVRGGVLVSTSGQQHALMGVTLRGLEKGLHQLKANRRHPFPELAWGLQWALQLQGSVRKGGGMGTKKPPPSSPTPAVSLGSRGWLESVPQRFPASLGFHCYLHISRKSLEP